MNANIINKTGFALAIATTFVTASIGVAQTYDIDIVAAGLSSPTGIAVQGRQRVYFTEVPTPGVSGDAGGQNTVNLLQLGAGTIDVLSAGEPEPVNLALGRNRVLYWTCRTAGVILQRTPNGTITPFLTGLDQPTGLAVRRADGPFGRTTAAGMNDVYFTQLPTPGIAGDAGGTNTVNVSDGVTVSTISLGEPEPTDVAVGPDGTLYWTCRTAGVILFRTPGGQNEFLLTGLDQPVGIAIDRRGETLYFTEVPTPGVFGDDGGQNGVYELDLTSDSAAPTPVNLGDPEPTDVTVAADGTVYWTCTTAGVIVRARPVH